MAKSNRVYPQPDTIRRLELRSTGRQSVSYIERSPMSRIDSVSSNYRFGYLQVTTVEYRKVQKPIPPCRSSY